MSTALNIVEASTELDKARKAYNEAHDNAERLRKAETSALNFLNRAQKAFDNAVAETRKGAPWNSDWNRTKGEAGE